MSYIYDPDYVELMGCKCDAAIARDEKGRRMTTPHRQTGLWLNVAIPRTGWTCVKIHHHMVNLHANDACGVVSGPCPDCISADALGKPRPVEWLPAFRTCEMCDAAQIKWVHTMFHPDYPVKLECGKVCAGILQQNMEAAAQFEKHAKAVDRARKRHADGLKVIREAGAGALSSDWDEAASRDGSRSWIDDAEWPSVIGDLTSFMVLEGIGDYWISVNRRGLKGYGANAGRMWRGDRQRGASSKRTYGSLAEAKRAAIGMMTGWWKARLDKNLAAVLERNRVVNEFGDVIDLG